MKIEVQRLNMDTSWWINIGGNRLVLDPWLVGSEVDGFKWLNEAWHLTPPTKPDEISEYELILISQSYSDHCHLPTLNKLNENTPIASTYKAFKKLKKGYDDRLSLIPDFISSDSFKFNEIRISSLHPKKKTDPVYYALLIQSEHGNIFYASHGFFLSDVQLDALKGINIDVLITTFTEFKIPGWMGGKVNPGMDNVRLLMNQLKPQKVLNTHDEEKVSRGLVGKLAKVKYPEYESISIPEFQHINHYNKLSL